MSDLLDKQIRYIGKGLLSDGQIAEIKALFIHD